MPTFDPTKPVANSPVSSSELRDQLNALNDKLSDIADPVHDWQANVSTLTQLTTTYTDPVTADNLNEIRDKLNEIIIDLTS